VKKAFFREAYEWYAYPPPDESSDDDEDEDEVDESR
jgi:hypothetical protein